MGFQLVVTSLPTVTISAIISTMCMSFCKIIRIQKTKYRCLYGSDGSFGQVHFRLPIHPQSIYLNFGILCNSQACLSDQLHYFMLQQFLPILDRNNKAVECLPHTVLSSMESSLFFYISSVPLKIESSCCYS